ncbi:hypothetical protein SAMN05216421_1115 [Halopseudomonas xinjiangensis]|uniref:Uncharacterized protein n=1 Tax=Halopseudomonas xinjiangensis TaxID=487184 RepID=A0A1H1QE71_9GAMM|nr:hypothetical protein [Halopseudomonas xinjiangensis]SDS21613.1 hypothetical protein SAMN05216421_1115 [Halopseudomonas xinjiangensis]
MQERTDRNRQKLAEREGRIRGNLNARQKRLEQGLVRDLSSLTPEPPQPTLRREEPRGHIPPGRGYAEHNLQPGTGSQPTGSGIASPLTETARTYAADPVWVESVDGFGYWRVKRVASITFEDAEGREVVFNYTGTQPAT